MVTCLAYCLDKELWKAIEYLKEQVPVLREQREKDKRVLLDNHCLLRALSNTTQRTDEQVDNLGRTRDALPAKPEPNTLATLLKRGLGNQSADTGGRIEAIGFGNAAARRHTGTRGDWRRSPSEVLQVDGSASQPSKLMPLNIFTQFG
jgi:hypothetical protein